MQISAIMRKFVDNLNNFCNFIGRHQTLKMHIQGKSADTNFSCCGAGHHSRSPPTATRPPGGVLRENLILIFQCWFSRRISRPTQNHGGRGRLRRKREKSTRKRRRTCKIQWISLEIKRTPGVTRWNPAKSSVNAVKSSEIQLFSLCIVWFSARNKNFWEILQKHLTIYIW